MQRALELDDTLGEAHTSLANLMTDDWDWRAAEREFRRAIELSPGYALAHRWYGHQLLHMGRFDEAWREIKTAHRLDPLSLIINANLAYHAQVARRYDEAIELGIKALELDPSFWPSRHTLGHTYLFKGMFEEAIAEFNEGIERRGEDPGRSTLLAVAYAMSGKRSEAIEIVNTCLELWHQEYVSAVGIANVYVALGETENAFEWLERAYEQREYTLTTLKISPAFDPIRGDPRFDDLVRRIGFEPDPGRESRGEPSDDPTGSADSGGPNGG